MTCRRLITILLAAALLTAACGGSDASETDTGDATSYETDLAGLEAIYPLGDFAVESVRWRHHNDFVNEANGSRDLPAQDGDKIVEAVLIFEDDSLRASLLDGRTTTMTDFPDWYPEALTSAAPATAAVSRTVDGLPGIVTVFPDVADFVVVSYDPNS